MSTARSCTPRARSLCLLLLTPSIHLTFACRIYTPQGDMRTWQCRPDRPAVPGGKTCSPPTTIPGRELLNKLVPHVDQNGALPEELVGEASCPHCGAAMFPNLRGGNWCVLPDGPAAPRLWSDRNRLRVTIMHRHR